MPRRKYLRPVPVRVPRYRYLGLIDRIAIIHWPADLALLKILRLRLRLAHRDRLVDQAALLLSIDTLLKVVLKHPLTVLGRPNHLDRLLYLANSLRFLRGPLHFHAREVEKDEVYVLDEFVKLSFITLDP